MHRRSESQLLGAISSGDREACAEFVHANHAAVYRFLLHLGRDPSQAEELTQETFAAAWQKIGEFEGRASFATWLHRIAYHKFLNSRRKSRREAALAVRVAARRQDPPQSGPLDQLVSDERAARLYDAVQSLADADRLVVVLHYFQGMAYRDMAAVLSEPPGTLRWRVSRALGRLKTLLTIESEDATRERTTNQGPDLRVVGS